MKILLINPPSFDQGENSRYLERTPIQTYTMPLGLGYIASVLEEAGNSVRILDAYVKNLSYEEIAAGIADSRPDVVGITCLSDQRASWIKLIKLVRSIDAGIKIVLGGPHPSLMTEQVLKNVCPDVIVIGEGEETMVELIRTWESGHGTGHVRGIAYLKNGETVINPPRERIQNIDSIPFPARHLVDLDDYGGWAFMEQLYKMVGLERPPKYATIITSRGCIGNCGYCSSPLIWKKRWTQRSAANVVDEIEMLVNKHGVEFIIMTDDIFTVNQKRAIAISEEIIKRGIKVLWGFETAVNLVSSELLHVAKKAGCCCILYGVESGSETILSNVTKKIREQDVLNAFRMTKEAGIVAGAFLMAGNPGESERSINDTIRLLRKIKPAFILPQIAMVTPATEVFNIAKKKGFIDESYWLTDLPFPYYTCERNLGTLIRWYKKLQYYEYNNLDIFFHTLRDLMHILKQAEQFRSGDILRKFKQGKYEAN